MAKTVTPKPWLRDNPVTSQLSSACLFRVLRATQDYITASTQVLAVRDEKRKQSQQLGFFKQYKCDHCNEPYHDGVANARDPEYITVDQLKRWQLEDA